MGAAPSLMCTTAAAKSKRFTGVTASCIAPYLTIPNGQPLGYTARVTVSSTKGPIMRPLRIIIPAELILRGEKVRRLIGAIWGGSVTPPQPEPEPPTQSGRIRGEWAPGTQYQAGDIFTYKGGLFAVKRSHTSSGGGGSPDMIDTPGIAHMYYERI